MRRKLSLGRKSRGIKKTAKKKAAAKKSIGRKSNWRPLEGLVPAALPVKPKPPREK